MDGSIERDACTRILPLRQLALWCYQRTAALGHAHPSAHTFHTDIKPGNMLIADDDGLVLIDWESFDGPPTTLAPEADGTWNVEEIVAESDGY